MLAFLLMSAIAGSVEAQQPPAAPPDDPCRAAAFEGNSYIVCTAPPGGAQLQIVWKDAAGQPYKQFSRLATELAASGHRVVFALNAGMYSDDFTPVGLFVTGGTQLVPLNTGSSRPLFGSVPNFYKKPNGVFFIDNQGGAHIVPTDSYQAQQTGDAAVPRYATQSGPMLVIDGKLHPALIPGSTDRTRRSGVGVCAGGTVRFAVSEEAVNFHDFARLFRDRLACQNALFLDGGRGVGLFDPVLKRDDQSGHGGYGPIFALVE